MGKIAMIIMVILISCSFSPYSLSATTRDADNNSMSEKVVSDKKVEEVDSESEFKKNGSKMGNESESENLDLEQDANQNEIFSSSDSNGSKKNGNTETKTNDEVDKEKYGVSVSESEKQEKTQNPKTKEDNQEQQAIIEGEKAKILTTSSTDIGVNTSKLGHIRSASAQIYEIPGNNRLFTAGDKYANAVYYIKKQADVDGVRFYLISKKPSSKEGVVGWVKASDLSIHDHVGVDKKGKTFYFTGKGSAYTKAWGGSKDLVYEDMSSYKHQKFHVNLTEKVGNNTWYRGNFNGKTIWLHESYLTTKEESNTSKLGHIRSEKVNIYKTISDTSTKFAAGEEYTNQVYYIKRQAKIGEQTFYLISLTPSREDGVIGWVQADDLSLHDHVGVDKKKKTLYFTGKGSAYTKAWGGSKDLVYKDMSSYESQAFHVNLTEKVGNNTWYRGKFNGKTIWLHESYLTMKDTNRISKLGHLHGNANIYKSLGDRSSLLNTSNYTNAVYYIKQQAKVNDQTYYLISKQPSVINGTVGWVNASDMSTHDHVGVDKKSKILKVVGTGSAYSKAWGGSKDLVYSDVSKFKGQEIKVNLTEKVGNNIWYRGTLNGKTVWFHESYLKKTKEVITDYTTYNLSLDKMLDLQMKVNPQTDKQYKLWIREDAFGSISNGKGTVKGENWNLRSGLMSRKRTS